MYRRITEDVVFTMPRCGSMSIQSCSQNADPQHGAIAFIRDPIERCISAWSFFQDYPFSLTCSWDNWVARILCGERDDHWIPQSELIRDGYFKRYVPFERIGEYVLIKKNSSTKRNPPVPLELKQYYMTDFELRSSICR